MNPKQIQMLFSLTALQTAKPFITTHRSRPVEPSSNSIIDLRAGFSRKSPLTSAAITLERAETAKRQNTQFIDEIDDCSYSSINAEGRKKLASKATRVYHRLESKSQSPELAAKQEKSKEIWGGATRNFYQSNFPKVQAYEGPLPNGVKGIEFTTDIEPDKCTPPGIASWSCNLPGVECDINYAKLRVKTIKNLQN